MSAAAAGPALTPPPPAAAGRQGRSDRPLPALTTAAAALVAAAAALPLAYLAWRARQVGLGRAVELVVTARTARLLTASATLALATAATAAVVGVPVAWLTARTDLPARRLLTVATALPLAVPSYVMALAVVATLGPRGAASRWLSPLGVERLPELYGFPGAWLTLSLATYPYVVLSVRGALTRLDPAQAEVARSLGRSGPGAFLAVTLPQLRGAIGAGALLTGLYSLSDFGAVSLLQYDTFTRVIYVQYRGSLDRSAASLNALVLAMATLVFVVAELRRRDRAGTGPATGMAPRRQPVVRLGRWRWPAFVAMAALVGASIAVPVATLVTWLVLGLRAGEPLGVTVPAVLHSAQAAGLAAAVTVVAAWPVSVLAARHPGRAVSRWLERAAYLGFALPGLVVALALVFFGARVVRPLYQTVPLLVFAYAVLFLPQAVGALRTTIERVSPTLEDASRSLGAGPAATTRRVLVPMVRPGAAAAFALVFLTAMKELPAALLLSPTGWETLAAQVWATTSEGFFGRAAAPALVLVAVSSVPLTFLALRREG